MNEIVLEKQQLPTNLGDLSKFVLVGREKLTAVRAEIRAIDKVGLAEEVRKQKLQEAQAISEAVLDAEMKIGELMEQIPKATAQNNISGKKKSDTQIDSGVVLGTDVEKEISPPKTKTEIIQESGFTPKQVERFQTLAKHPEIVEQAKAEARENDDIVSRSAVLKKIDETRHPEKIPHVSFNSGNNEWYTPLEIIRSARLVMGSIDLDPASNEIANEVVQATTFYTAETDGLAHEWCGNVWLNPPYSSDLIGKFADKVLSEYGNYSQMIVLVNNATETEWFSKLIQNASAVVFPKSRVKFYMPDGKTGAPLQGQAIIYIGDFPEKFMKHFQVFGWGAFLDGVS